MRKLNLLVIAFFVSHSFATKAFPQSQDSFFDTKVSSKPKLEWNKSFEGGFGYSHIYNNFGSDSFDTEMPQGLLHADFNIFGFYFGAGMASKKTGYSVYGYDEKVESYVIKLGFSMRLILNDESKFTFTPYLGWASYTVDDTSGNAIGQRQDYGTKKTKFLVGGKLSYAYKWFEVGTFASNIEAGVSVGVNVDFD